MLVLEDARIATDLFRALCVMKEVRIVRLFPHEYQVSGGHEACNERAPRGRTGEGVRPDAEPAAVVCLLASPQLFLPAELPLGENGVPRLDAALLHREKATRLDRASFGHSRRGSGSLPRSRSRARRGARLVARPPGPFVAWPSRRSCSAPPAECLEQLLLELSR